MTERDEQAFVDRLRQQLDRQADELDELTLARLRAARARALEQARGGARSHAWLPAAGMAVAAALVAAVLLWPSAPKLPAGADDLDLLAAGEDMELIEELEFYDWLDRTQSPAG
ncbi:MAG TPA: DUF3619 family protein [Gammaproteobacteria bacterium]|nr:DUF3619 family protein [Gammaproteobacteria bacterium]